jgi:integrase
MHRSNEAESHPFDHPWATSKGKRNQMYPEMYPQSPYIAKYPIKANACGHIVAERQSANPLSTTVHTYPLSVWYLSITVDTLSTSVSDCTLVSRIWGGNKGGDGSMARLQSKLTDAACRSAREAGRLSDGGGLYLVVKPTGAKSWVFMWKQKGRRREMGLGAFPEVKLARARALAAEQRAKVSEGGDPIRDRQRVVEPSFGDCAEHFLEAMEVQWRNPKHRAQWRMTLTKYAAPLSGKRVSEIDTEDVLGVLTPLWAEIPETASRLRGRIERVLDYARARGWRSGENPALWRGHLKNVLPAPAKLARGHHAAMPYSDVPAFVARLRGLNSASSRALEFLVLTAARSGEVREALWTEFDVSASLWTIPGARMKAGRIHRVPLVPRAIEILESMEQSRVSDYAFPGQKSGRPLSLMAFTMQMRRLDAGEYTVHGFRSAFRDWAGDQTNVPREIAEAALAHSVGDATERAYRRGDALAKRRDLMESWAAHCAGGGTADGEKKSTRR